MSLFTSLRAIVNSRQRVERGPPRRLLEPLDIEAVRYSGEHEGASRVRGTKGFRKTLQERQHELRIHPGRRSNLAEAMRLEASAAPELFEAIGELSAVFGLRDEIEVYQDVGPLNLAMASTERGPMLTLEGPVLEVFSGVELRGLLGHELAHFVCHSGPQAVHREESRVASVWRHLDPYDDSEALRVLAGCELSVAQEITADRFELLASQDLDVYLATSLKMSTELDDAVVRHDPGVLLRQSREALRESTGDISRTSTHPERHLRVRAAELFVESDLFRRMTGQGPGSRPIGEVNREIFHLLAGWVPRGASSLEQEPFEQFLLAAAAAIVSADGTFRSEERAFLSRTLPLAWRGKLPEAPDALVDAFAAKVKRAKDTRAMLTTLNFLCGLVEADGQPRDAEFQAIDVVGRALGARDLFRHELRERYSFDVSEAPAGVSREADDAVSEASPSLLRYLDTVVAAGQRRTTLRRLLTLGGHGRRTPLALEKLAAVLDASGVVASEPLPRARLEAPLVLRAEDADARGPRAAAKARRSRPG